MTVPQKGGRPSEGSLRRGGETKRGVPQKGGGDQARGPSEGGKTKRGRSDAFRARAALLFVAIAITLASLSSPLWAPQFELQLEPSAITPEIGLAYTTPLPQPKLPFPLDVPTDTWGDAGQTWNLGKMACYSALHIRFMKTFAHVGADDSRTGTTIFIFQPAMGRILA
jgi:hypothetical protein